MAKIIVFNKQNFNGNDTLVVTDSLPSLKGTGINNDISSVIVIEGSWQLCEHPDYQGTDWVVAPNGGPNQDGCYPSYSDWGGQNNEISSIQSVS